MARRKRKKWRLRKPPQDYRDPPMPSWFYTAPLGTCRWCGELIKKPDGTIRSRANWHQDCLHPYFLITRQSYAKRAVKQRDKGICAKCGKKCKNSKEWQLDHIVPLKDIPERDVKYWGLENLWCLCIGCHTKKTIEENANRRKTKMDKGKNSKRDNE